MVEWDSVDNSIVWFEICSLFEGPPPYGRSVAFQDDIIATELHEALDAEGIETHFMTSYGKQFVVWDEQTEVDAIEKVAYRELGLQVRVPFDEEITRRQKQVRLCCTHSSDIDGPDKEDYRRRCM